MADSGYELREVCYKCGVRYPRSEHNSLCLVCMAETEHDIKAQIKKLNGPIIGT